MLFNSRNKPLEIPAEHEALPHREHAVTFNSTHYVNGNTITEPVPANLDKAVFALGCFWGAERLFWELEGVFSTAVGYSGGITHNPSYEDVCSGKTGHTEVVLVFFDPAQISYQHLLAAFWEAHDPTQGMQQGADIGTQYRSAIYASSAGQLQQAQESATQFQAALQEVGRGEITTEIKELGDFFYAEDYHQQYLAKNPGGYCGLAGTGACYTPAITAAEQ